MTNYEHTRMMHFRETQQYRQYKYRTDNKSTTGNNKLFKEIKYDKPCPWNHLIDYFHTNWFKEVNSVAREELQKPTNIRNRSTSLFIYRYFIYVSTVDY